MRIDVVFEETAREFPLKAAEVQQPFDAAFADLLIVERTDIPPQYGLITYDQNRTITVT